MNNIERINKIKKDNSVLIEKVKGNIVEAESNLLKNIDYIFFIINFNQDNNKKMEQNKKYKEKMLNAISTISKTDDIEVINKGRKTLNYYFNNIIKELINKNVSQDVIDGYKNALIQYRNEIAKYVRYIKRINNIREMTKLNNNFDTLTDEEKIALKKIIRREQNYNSKNLKINNLKVNSINIAKNKNNTLILDKTASKEEKTIEFLDRKVSDFNAKYKLRQVNIDNKNGLTLIKNIPNYLQNQKRIKMMRIDNALYYRGLDFSGFIEYHKKRNSFKNVLKMIFVPSYRNSKEAELLNNDDNCALWIKEKYYKDNEKTLSKRI